MPITTLHEVARTAGVSKSTVSRVINKSTRVAPHVAQTVLEAMERMGYQPPARRPGPKPAARKGVKTGSLLLLALGFHPDDPYGMRGYPWLLRGVENAVRESGLKLVVASLSADGALPVALDPREVDGVILFGKSNALSASAKTRLQEIPAVCLMRGFDEFRGQLDRVLFNNSAIGSMAARYLHSRGHKRVAFYSINPAHQALIPRHRDFLATATELGMDVSSFVSDHTSEGFPQEIAEHQRLTEQLLASPQRVTGVFVPLDFWAVFFYQSLAARRVTPGTNLEVISCDNIPLFLDQLKPRPTTIDTNLELVGRRGVEQLLWRMANTTVKNPIEQMIEPILIPSA